MLSVQSLEVRYEGIAAVRDVSFDLDAGECLALIGPNGAGKSSTLRAISGLAPVSSGKIAFLGSDITNNRPHEIARLGIAHVPEGRHIFGPLTVEDNLLLGRQRIGTFSVSEGLDFVYGILPKLKERRTQQASSLSGGEQQMVAIGRAIIGQPKLLMLDEPSMGLAPQIVDAVFELLASLRSAGQTVLLVEQNAELAMDFAQRCVVLSVGEIQLAGTSEELKTRQDIIDAYLGTF